MVTSGLPLPTRSRVRSSPAPAQRPVSAIRGSGSVRGVTSNEPVEETVWCRSAMPVGSATRTCSGPIG